VPLISLYIEEKVKNDVKKLGLRHAGVYMRGFDSIVNKNSYEEALAEQKKKLERMSHLLDHYIMRSVKAEDTIKELQGDMKCFGTKKRK